MKQARFNSLLWALGFAALAIGTAVYFFCRPNPPLLIRIWLGYRGMAHCGNLPAVASLPSCLHALGFTCLLGASWGGGRVALLVSGTFWFVANALWEWACNVDFPWAQMRTRAVQVLLGRPELVHSCTTDVMDIFAAAVGAAFPILLYLVLCSASYGRALANNKE